MVAHATPPTDVADLARARVSALIARGLLNHQRFAIIARFTVELPHADHATRQRAIDAFTTHLATSIHQHLVASYQPGVDCVLAVDRTTFDGWVESAILDALAAARCP
jgi:hypothetical protein